MDEYYEDDYDDDERRGRGRLFWMITGLFGAGALAWLVVIPGFQGESATTTNTRAAATSTTSTDSTTVTSTTVTSTTVTSTTAGEATVTSATAGEATVTSATVGEATVTSIAVQVDPPATNGSATTTENPSTTESEAAQATASYPTLPDGSPVPVLAVFDTETITISGVVRSEDAAVRLALLAIANSKFPEAEVVNTMTVDPTIPSNVGVRVIEMNSVRFPESSAELLPEHRGEIDRAAEILRLFPNVSVLVIGHADQRGSAETNFVISEERARSVSTYFVETGIDPSRVSSRAVGELDLLALDDDAQSFALNRRTEFVFYGLLTDAG